MTPSDIAREEIERQKEIGGSYIALDQGIFDGLVSDVEQVALRCMERWEEYLGEMVCYGCGLTAHTDGDSIVGCAAQGKSWGLWTSRLSFNQRQKEKG